MKVGLFGTFDVDNFGDLLFPLIVSSKLEGVEVIPFSPTSMKTSFTDALQATAVSDNVLEPLSGVIIGGGNIIRLSSSYLNNYVNCTVEHVAYPNIWFTPTLNNLDNSVPIIWNCPGVSESLDGGFVNSISDVLERTNYISVRDDESADLLRVVNHDINVSIVPDSAWQISEIFKKEELKSLFLEVIRGEQKRKYATFHFNDRYLTKNSLSSICRYVESICIQFDVTPILLALGNCHNDEHLIRNIAEGLTIDSIVVDKPDSLKKCIAILAHSIAYFGSSMHGFIISSSYGNMAICVAEDKIKFDGIQKLFSNTQVYFNSWDSVYDKIDLFNYSQRIELSREVTRNASRLLSQHWIKIRGLLADKTREDEEFIFKGIDNINLSMNSKRIEMMQKKIRELNLLIRNKNKEIYRHHQVISEQQLRLNRFYVRGVEKIAATIGRVPYSKRVYVKGKNILFKCVDQIQSILRRKLSKEFWSFDSDEIARLEAHRNSESKRRFAVVTAVYGDYDALMLPKSIDERFDYYCFSDIGRETFGLWKLCSAPYYDSDPTRVARFVKTHLHTLFPNYDVVVWCDGNVRFDYRLGNKVEEFDRSNFELSLVRHPLRNCLYDEAEACIERGKDSVDKIRNQIERYKKKGFPRNYGMYETNLYLVKPKYEKVHDFYRIWWHELKVGSRRDQLSVTFALQQSEVHCNDLFDTGYSVRNSEGFEIFEHKKSRYLTAPKSLKALSKYCKPNFNYEQTQYRNLGTTLPHNVSIGVIICVYNALEDVTKCLNSVFEYSGNVSEVTIVNDNSDEETTNYLREFSKLHKVNLIENVDNLGYTKSANLGLSSSVSDFKILLNSDAIVTPNWDVKLATLAYSSNEIGIVGPISNAASSQSVPDIKGTKGQTAINNLPSNLTPNRMNEIAESFKVKGYPSVPLIHGFCICIKAEVIRKIGYFDDVNFERYYGEENDYCLRAYNAGYELAIATNTFVFHAKSKSIEDEERLIHMEKAGQKLRSIYGSDAIRNYCLQLEHNPVLVQLRIHFKKEMGI
ncbi:glycosyltransferase [Vibrio cincinnatiensis]|uniref:glycosyltransferase n=1 Tax=Vibrio cincinnatiensis TaxID=675 RepID=UPI001EDEAFF5|nr:glycosyltransferase [Vibrio cincinnatiensis]